MSPQFSVVTRPAPSPRAKRTGMMQALRETATTGKAVRILRDGPLGGGYGTALREQGYALHEQRDGDYVIAWCERRYPREA